MTQLSRLISILTLLRSKRLITATELAGKYEVSVRTIYRDIRKLEEAGVPITTVEGRGYSLMEGYQIAPVQFTEKEVNALITAQQLVKQTKDKSFTDNFNEAFTKIKSVFRSSLLEKSERLERQIHVFDPNYYENITSNALSEIQLAITHLNYVEINYQKADDIDVTFRKIEPYAFYSTNHKWILIAWCYLRMDYRAFRIDRIQEFKILTDHYSHRGFDLQKYFQEEIKKYKNIKS